MTRDPEPFDPPTQGRTFDESIFRHWQAWRLIDGPEPTRMICALIDPPPGLRFVPYQPAPSHRMESAARW